MLTDRCRGIKNRGLGRKGSVGIGALSLLASRTDDLVFKQSCVDSVRRIYDSSPHHRPSVKFQALQSDRVAMNTTLIASGPTGHFPVEAEIVGYLANTYPVSTLLGLFAAGWVVILGTTNLLIKRHNPTLGSGDKAAVLWFVLSELGAAAPLGLSTMLTLVYVSRDYTSVL